MAGLPREEDDEEWGVGDTGPHPVDPHFHHLLWLYFLRKRIDAETLREFLAIQGNNHPLQHDLEAWVNSSLRECSAGEGEAWVNSVLLSNPPSPAALSGSPKALPANPSIASSSQQPPSPPSAASSQLQPPLPRPVVRLAQHDDAEMDEIYSGLCL
ncbi:hypothetical protein KI387_006698, partial [Taxus chinensis]